VITTLVDNLLIWLSISISRSSHEYTSAKYINTTSSTSQLNYHRLAFCDVHFLISQWQPGQTWMFKKI